jgi:FkbM family methyltransferase
MNGRAVRVPVDKGLGMNLLVRDEPWMHLLVDRLPGLFPGLFLDVGVNLGQTLCAVRTRWPELPYIGFEPNPACIQYARELALVNGFKNVPIVPAGLAERDGLMTMELHTEDLADSAATMISGLRQGVAAYRSFSIPTLRYATVEQSLGLGRIGIVKIDVEGGEREVLLGAEGQLLRDRPAVVFEILPVDDQPMRLPRQQDVEALLARINYTLHRIHGLGAQLRLERMEKPIGVITDQKFANYLALPAERENELVGQLEGQAIPQQ